MHPQSALDCQTGKIRVVPLARRAARYYWSLRLLEKTTSRRSPPRLGTHRLDAPRRFDTGGRQTEGRAGQEAGAKVLLRIKAPLRLGSLLFER